MSQKNNKTTCSQSLFPPGEEAGAQLPGQTLVLLSWALACTRGRTVSTHPIKGCPSAGCPGPAGLSLTTGSRMPSLSCFLQGWLADRVKTSAGSKAKPDIFSHHRIQSHAWFRTIKSSFTTKSRFKFIKLVQSATLKKITNTNTQLWSNSVFYINSEFLKYHK